MKHIKYLSLIGLLLFLAACTAERSSVLEVPEIVEADILLPAEMEPDEEYQLQVLVTQGGEPVMDADEVLFELWNDSEGSESTRIEAIHIGQGIYLIDQTFGSTGVYTIQTHITARALHIMPKSQFRVGDVTDEQVKRAEENTGKQKSDHMNNQDEGEHHH